MAVMSKALTKTVPTAQTHAGIYRYTSEQHTNKSLE